MRQCANEAEGSAERSAWEHNARDEREEEEKEHELDGHDDAVRDIQGIMEIAQREERDKAHEDELRDADRFRLFAEAELFPDHIAHVRDETEWTKTPAPDAAEDDDGEDEERPPQDPRRVHEHVTVVVPPQGLE